MRWWLLCVVLFVVHRANGADEYVDTTEYNTGTLEVNGNTYQLPFKVALIANTKCVEGCYGVSNRITIGHMAGFYLELAKRHIEADPSLWYFHNNSIKFEVYNHENTAVVETRAIQSAIDAAASNGTLIAIVHVPTDTTYLPIDGFTAMTGASGCLNAATSAAIYNKLLIETDCVSNLQQVTELVRSAGTDWAVLDDEFWSTSSPTGGSSTLQSPLMPATIARAVVQTAVSMGWSRMALLNVYFKNTYDFDFRFVNSLTLVARQRGISIDKWLLIYQGSLSMFSGKSFDIYMKNKGEAEASDYAFSYAHFIYSTAPTTRVYSIYVSGNKQAAVAGKPEYLHSPLNYQRFLVTVLCNAGLLQTGQYGWVIFSGTIIQSTWTPTKHVANQTQPKKPTQSWTEQRYEQQDFSGLAFSPRGYLMTEHPTRAPLISQGDLNNAYRNLLRVVPATYLFNEKYYEKVNGLVNEKLFMLRDNLPCDPGPWCNVNRDKNLAEIYLQYRDEFPYDFFLMDRKMLLIYDTFMFVIRLMQTMLETDTQTAITDGRLIRANALGSMFEWVPGVTDQFMLDGTRMGTMYLKSSSFDNSQLRMVDKFIGYFGINRTADERDNWNVIWMPSESSESIKWIGGAKPTDGPRCGYYGELCPTVVDGTAVVVSIVLAGLLLLFVTVALIIYKKLQYERSLYADQWRVWRDELTLKPNFTGRGSKSFASLLSEKSAAVKSMTSLKQNDEMDYALNLNDYKVNMLKEEQKQKKMAAEKQRHTGAFRRKKAFDDPMNSLWDELDKFTLALHHNNLVGLTKIYKPVIELDRMVRKELKMVRDTRNDNLAHVIGLVHEPPHVFLLTDFAERGALKDILENTDFQLDDMFRNSITNDLVKGLRYLHGSDIGCHGALRSSNCLVDARWNVRLSGYGLHITRLGEHEDELTDDRRARHELWTAPELMREPISQYLTEPERNQWAAKLRMTDVYSVAIIFHEIYARQGPFGVDFADPIDIIEAVKYPTKEGVMRPDVSLCVPSTPNFMKDVMEHCWQEDPTLRPTIAKIKKMTAELQKGMKGNIFDHMMTLMEKYTNNLEGVVRERTSELEEERKRSERLLLQMLPPTVADNLKQGLPVQAQYFDSVSIYFSDIVGFTSMSSQSTPIQVVNFLNDLYTTFDAIIDNYDVYKVETIGDAYMVVSGLPVSNGIHHAGEISSMSLSLLSAIKVFRIRHRPDDVLKLRIGIHSGPCVTGVVGLKMPRYCLFGDTVNTASRMESNGEAFKIHASGECVALLNDLGGYVIQERGLVAMKGKGDQLTYWVLSEDKEFRKLRLTDAAHQYPSLKKAVDVEF